MQLSNPLSPGVRGFCPRYDKLTKLLASDGTHALPFWKLGAWHGSHWAEIRPEFLLDAPGESTAPVCPASRLSAAPRSVFTASAPRPHLSQAASLLSFPRRGLDVTFHPPG